MTPWERKSGGSLSPPRCASLAEARPTEALARSHSASTISMMGSVGGWEAGGVMDDG